MRIIYITVRTNRIPSFLVNGPPTGKTMTENIVKHPKFLSNPQTAKEYTSRARWKHKREDYRGAVEDYTMAISLKPESADLYYDRAGSKKFSKDYQGAVEDYTKVLELDPEDEVLCVGHNLTISSRGSAKYSLGDYQGAIEDYTKCLDLDPYSYSTYCARGQAKCELVDKEGAAHDWKKALELLEAEKKECFQWRPGTGYDEESGLGWSDSDEFFYNKLIYFIHLADKM